MVEEVRFRRSDVDSCISAMKGLSYELKNLLRELKEGGVCNRYEPGSRESILCKESLDNIYAAMNVLWDGETDFAKYVIDAIVGLSSLGLMEYAKALSSYLEYTVNRCIEPYSKLWGEEMEKEWGEF